VYEMTKRKIDPKLAVAYLRASTDDQRLSPEAQRADIEAWARREAVTIVDWHVDQGISGGSDIADRPGLAAALAAVKVNCAGVLIVAKRDRLARDSYIAMAIDRAVERMGGVVVTADGTGNGTSPADAFMRQIMDAAAQYERAMIRSRTKAALAVKKARGERMTFAVPYGSRLAADGVHLETDVGEQGVIERVLAMREAGVAMRGIVAELEASGVVSRRGRALGLTQVARIAGRTA
jgi:DNA invertase Pin-like site-specific DNA recombinase